MEDNLLYENKTQETKPDNEFFEKKAREMIEGALSKRDEEYKRQAEQERKNREEQIARETKALRDKEETEYLNKYKEQPREIKDKLMQYSDQVGVPRQEAMKFADKIARESGKDLKEVSKFLLDNKNNSDFDLKDGSYEEIINKFVNGIKTAVTKEEPTMIDNDDFMLEEKNYEPRFENLSQESPIDALLNAARYEQTLKAKGIPPAVAAAKFLELSEQQTRLLQLNQSKAMAENKMKADKQRIRQEEHWAKKRIENTMKPAR